LPNCKEKGYNKILLVTDKNLRQLGITAKLEESLINNDIKAYIYDKTAVNPTVLNVEEALELYKENKCECIVAFGGGSPMDCAKVVGARVSYPKKSVSQMKGILKIMD
jgi:alcohol dehydrogenase class IV